MIVRVDRLRLVNYKRRMLSVIETEEFTVWLKNLRDQVGRRQINRRIARIASLEHFGDWASVGDGVAELRVHFGPGYRVYYVVRQAEVVILLCGGVKDRQDRDIARAKMMAAEIDLADDHSNIGGTRDS